MPKDKDVTHMADEEARENQEQAPLGEPLGLPGTRGLLLGAGILFLALSHVTAFFLGYFLGLPKAGLVEERAPHLQPTPTQAFRDLGLQDHSFDDTAQAQALLALLVEQSGHKQYIIRFNRESEHVNLTCDFTDKTLTRSTTHPNGSGRTERWRGDVLERLRNASGGRGFSSTEHGAHPAETSSFTPRAAPID